jgi:hypothetical protein
MKMKERKEDEKIKKIREVIAIREVAEKARKRLEMKERAGPVENKGKEKKVGKKNIEDIVDEIENFLEE